MTKRPVDYSTEDAKDMARGINPDNRKDCHKFTLPNSGIGNGPPKALILLEPNDEIIEQCLDVAGQHNERGPEVVSHQAQLEQLRHCIKRFGDTEYTYSKLSGDKLMHAITSYERSYILKALERLTTPKDKDMRAFLESMEPAT